MGGRIHHFAGASGEMLTLPLPGHPGAQWKRATKVAVYPKTRQAIAATNASMKPSIRFMSERGAFDFWLLL